jgi:hypothetical protein
MCVHCHKETEIFRSLWAKVLGYLKKVWSGALDLILCRLLEAGKFYVPALVIALGIPRELLDL